MRALLNVDIIKGATLDGAGSVKCGLSVNLRVPCPFNYFISHLSPPQGLVDVFPESAAGIKSFYDECWVVFNALNG